MASCQRTGDSCDLTMNVFLSVIAVVERELQNCRLRLDVT